LQELPRERYEAAAIDGATPWQQIRSGTIPLLNRTTGLVILLQIIASLKIFDQVFLMTSGGPGISTQVSLGLITNTAFTDNRVGAASAASVLLFLVIVVISILHQTVSRMGTNSVHGYPGRCRRPCLGAAVPDRRGDRHPPADRQPHGHQA